MRPAHTTMRSDSGARPRALRAACTNCTVDSTPCSVAHVAACASAAARSYYLKLPFTTEQLRKTVSEYLPSIAG